MAVSDRKSLKPGPLLNERPGFFPWLRAIPSETAAWLRLLAFRCRADPPPAILEDRNGLRALRALAALFMVGALVSFLADLREPESPSAEPTVSPSAAFAEPKLPSPWRHSAPMPPPVPPSERAAAFLHHAAPENAAVAMPEAGVSVRAGLSMDAAPYREGSFAPLADGARQVDAALLQTLARLKMATFQMKVMDSETRVTQSGQVYPFLRLHLLLFPAPHREAPTGKPATVREKDVIAALREALRVWAPRARLRREGPSLYFVTVEGEVTHSLHCGGEGEAHGLPALPLARPDAGDPFRLERQPDARPRLTIVIDDLGENLDAARKLAALPYPVTFSVWPRSAHAAYVATLAREARRQVFVHQPMEPVGHAPGDANPDVLTVDMDRAALAANVAESLRLVPYAEGINNHMGSRFTSDHASVRVFCEEIRRLRPDILVLDSLTLGASVLYDEARRQGLAAFRRTLFLDDEQERHNKAAVLKVLDQGLNLARQHGRAVVIGHPHPATLAALAAWSGYRAGDVHIAPLAFGPDNTNGGPSAPHTETP